MPEYQLPVAIALAATTAVSAVAYTVSHGNDEGNIKLVEEAADSDHDPFAVTTPEDVIDGEPLGLPAFWASVRTCSGITNVSLIVRPYRFGSGKLS
jgi:hypothetical protein